MLNQEQIRGHWNEIKGALRKKWGELTDNDLEMSQGNFEKIRGAIQKKYGQSKEEAERELEKILGVFGEKDTKH